MMADDSERQAIEFGEQQQREFKSLQRFITPRLKRAERAYRHALNSLSLANAGAALATLTFIGGAWQKGTSNRLLLVPLCLFVVGLISMGLGTVVSLVKEAGTIKRMESMTSVREILGLRENELKSQSEIAGLMLDPRTWAAIVSAGTLVLGIIAGVVIISWPSLRSCI
jgi:hypothetical protein